MKSAEEHFIYAARKHGQATLEGDAPATNRNYKILVAALKELRGEPDRGESSLLAMLESDDLSVVAWAASYLLNSREKEAVAALNRVAASDTGLIGFGAEMVLKEWRAGRLKID